LRDDLKRTYETKMRNGEIPLDEDQIITIMREYAGEESKALSLESGIDFRWISDMILTVDKRQFITKLIKMHQLWRIQTALRTFTANPLFEAYTSLIYEVLPELERYVKGRMEAHEFKTFYRKAAKRYVDEHIYASTEIMMKSRDHSMFNDELNKKRIIPDEWMRDQRYYSRIRGADLWNGIQKIKEVLTSRETPEAIKEWLLTEDLASYEHIKGTDGIYMMIKLIPRCLRKELRKLERRGTIWNDKWRMTAADNQISVSAYHEMKNEIEARAAIVILDLELITQMKRQIEYPIDIRTYLEEETAERILENGMWITWKGYINLEVQTQHLIETINQEQEVNDNMEGTSQRFRPKLTMKMVEEAEKIEKEAGITRDNVDSRIEVEDLSVTMSMREISLICKKLDTLQDVKLVGRDHNIADWADVEHRNREQINKVVNYTDLKNGEVIIKEENRRRSRRYKISYDLWTRELLLTKVNHRMWD